MILYKDKQITECWYPSGAVLPYAGLSAPEGWLLADGAAYSQADYPELFEAIGTMYNTTAGAGDFNVPDMRQSFAEGSDDGDYYVGTSIAPSIPSHSHSFTGTSVSSSNNGSHTHTRGDMNVTANQMAAAYGYGDVNTTWNGCVQFDGGYNNDCGGLASGSACHYGEIQFDASKGWSGASSEIGSHTHTFTAKGTVENAGDLLSIYKGTTVQPKSLAMNWIIKC